MLSYSHALEHLQERVQPLAAELQMLPRAAGRTLATDMVAPHPMPPFDQSLMDGYAVRSVDTRQATPEKPRRLPLYATLTAGETLDQPLRPGHALRIMTGALMPSGADAVVRLEDGEIEGDHLMVRGAIARGQYLQRRGAEVRQDAVISRAGERLTPQLTGMALALGLSQVMVVRPPRLTLVAPGDELLPPGAPLQPGKKWCSNIYALDVRAQALGCATTNLGIVPDALEALVAALHQGLSSDVIIILGASGRGDHDFAARAMAAIGAETIFRGVAMAPGRGVALAICDQTLIFGLPGSPWAAFITFEVLVRLAIQAMLGQRPSRPMPARLTTAMHVRRGFTHIIPARLQPGTEGMDAFPLGDLHQVAQAEADTLGFVLVPPHRRRLLAGTRVSVLPA